MFEGHFGLRENPFVAAHQSRYIYPSPEHQEALAHLRYGIENREPFVLITGEVGTGKTTALFDALSEWEGRAVVGLITNSSLTRAELLEEIALRLGMTTPANASKPQVMVALERHLLAIHAEGLRAILLLDEAQNLERELLEEIRLLSNLETAGEKLLQIFLVGQPELEGRLQLPELRQLRQRIAVHYRLRPLGPADAERYVHHRITVAGGHALSIFPPDACAEVHRLTHGIPREMNHLCSQSMVCAFADGAPAVTLEHVRAAAHELEFQSVLGKERRTRQVPPAVERRQGPTIPGAAPPPEREMRVAPARAPQAGPANAAPAPVAPAAPAALPPPVTHPEPPALSAAAAGPADRTEAPGAIAPAPARAPDVSEPESGPPRWNPAEFERRTDPADEIEAEVDDADDGDLEDGEVQDAYDDLEDDDDAVSVDLEDAEDLEHLPETGPPRLDIGASATDPPHARPDAPPREVEPPAVRETAAPTHEPPAPAASGEDWQTWFKSLAREVEDTARNEALEEPAALASEGHPPGGLVAQPLGEDLHDDPHSDTVDIAPAPVARTAEPPVVETAASTSAFAAALRRTQTAPPAARDEARGHVRDSAIEAPAAQAAGPAGRSRPPVDAPASFESLPPRLREKMAQAAESPRESNPMPARIMIAAVLLLVVVAGAILAQRVLFSDGGAPGGAQSGSEAAPAEGADAGDAGASGPEAPAPPSTTSGSTASTSQPAATQGADAAPPETRAAEPVAPAPARAFVIAVGTYLNETRALDERTRLATSTSHDVRITTVHDDGVAMYLVTLGDFPSRTAAERAASDMISRGLVDEARIMAAAAR